MKKLFTYFLLLTIPIILWCGEENQPSAIHNKLLGEYSGWTNKERKQFYQINNNIETDYSDLCGTVETAPTDVIEKSYPTEKISINTSIEATIVSGYSFSSLWEQLKYWYKRWLEEEEGNHFFTSAFANYAEYSEQSIMSGGNCSTNLLSDGSFESNSPFLNRSFPNIATSPTANLRTTTQIDEWVYEDGDNNGSAIPSIRDATRASDGDYFVHILTGDTVSVTPPNGGNFAFLMDGGNDLDGTNGRYGWIATDSPVTAGRYTMTYTPPMGYANTGTSGGVGDEDTVLDPNDLTMGGDNPHMDDPLLLGSDINGGGTELQDFSAAANPFFFDFDLEQGEPFVDLNNLPVTGYGNGGGNTNMPCLAVTPGPDVTQIALRVLRG